MEELENPLLYNVRDNHDQYTDYYVDDNCNVYKLENDQLIIRKTHRNHEGRPRISFKANNERISTFTYRLLMKEYTGMSSEEFSKLVVDHLDCNPRNNHVSNLEVVTQDENMRRAGVNNLIPFGEDHHNSKYSDKLVESICKDIADGSLSRLDMRKKYDINGQLIDDIRAGRSHKKISSKYVDQGFEYSDWNRPAREEKARIVCSYIEKGYKIAQIVRETGFGFNFVEPVFNKRTFKYISDQYNI